MRKMLLLSFNTTYYLIKGVQVRVGAHVYRPCSPSFILTKETAPIKRMKVTSSIGRSCCFYSQDRQVLILVLRAPRRPGRPGAAGARGHIAQAHIQDQAGDRQDAQRDRHHCADAAGHLGHRTHAAVLGCAPGARTFTSGRVG